MRRPAVDRIDAPAAPGGRRRAIGAAENQEDAGRSPRPLARAQMLLRRRHGARACLLRRAAAYAASSVFSTSLSSITLRGLIQLYFRSFALCCGAACGPFALPAAKTARAAGWHGHHQSAHDEAAAPRAGQCLRGAQRVVARPRTSRHSHRCPCPSSWAVQVSCRPSSGRARAR